MRKNDEVRIQILATSDIHSHILEGHERSHIYRAGTYIEFVREQYAHTLLLDNGGSLAGSMSAFYYAIVAPYKRHPMIKLMNALDYDASGISTNEFKFGLDFLNRSVALARFPWLSANITYATTREPYFSTPYLVRDYEGVRIVVVGLTSDVLVRNEYIEMERDIAVEHASTDAKRWIRYIYEVEEPDFLVVLYHGDDEKENQIAGKIDTSQAEMIMKEAGIVDLMITGHQYETTIDYDGRTVCVQAGQNAEKLVHIDVAFRKRRNTNELLEVIPKIVELKSYEEHTGLLSLTHYDRKALRKWACQQVSIKPIAAHFTSWHALMEQQRHPFIQLLHNSMKSVAECDITCVHLPLPHFGGLSGYIDNQTLYQAYPHPDKPIELVLTGKEIRQLIEITADQLVVEAGNLSLNSTQDPTLYLFWSGFNYTIDMSKPSHQKVVDLSLREDYAYRIAMTDYCYRHYQKYLNHPTIHHSYTVSMPELMAQVLQTSDPITIEDESVKIINIKAE
ncbi:bifunctional UDP-sugar hydrolase/5'-nucleotidase [Staphylococcus sp. 17KM0847]|uniref:bifunctional metallophosphatase/5'-nucleotidase n=1 Tax=Staphylococcus sp. 17KM0847 TaxID=2583989 RepID=UPI0015DC1A50|nr:bifunctional UDP-sugar hydrolase/5'-nucleotidase [Staphylococcus sp. 17KM0847]QLK85672.1 bifunctional metallophosphatase/5'-nucleotidase [Staphylococcus sp. 17KM0847]